MKLSMYCVAAAAFLASPAWAQIEFFHGTWQEAVAKGKQENKAIFVDAYAQWCGPCKWMSANTFMDAAVGNYFNTNFVNLKLDMESSNGQEFAKKFPVDAYPTYVFLDGSGKEIHRQKGSMPAADFVTVGQTAQSKFKPNPNPNPQTAGINFFHGTWQEAVAKGKAENKPIFVDAYAQWCGPCKWMSTNTFLDAAVGNYFNANFVNLKLDMETPNGREFAQKFPIAAYPTYVFLDGNSSKEIHRQEGSMGADDFIAVGKTAKDKSNNNNPNPNNQGGTHFSMVYDGGSFEYLGNKKWLEHSANGEFNFIEKEQYTNDDDVSVALLYDQNRGTWIELPLYGKGEMSRISSDGLSWSDLYTVERVAGKKIKNTPQPAIYRFKGGSFETTDGVLWVEKGANGEVKFNFALVPDDTAPDVIYIYDETRNCTILIPKQGGQSMVVWDGSENWSNLYLLKKD